MNVTEKSWHTSVGGTYRSYGLKESRKNQKDTVSQSKTQTPQTASDTDILEKSALSAVGTDPESALEKSGSGFNMKSSAPKNTVGELASMLSKAETVIDVQQVMSKAMRALADLKMGSMASEGKEAKKYAQQIKRMEKLIKRIQKKLKHLSKEQRMEEQRDKALKHAEEQKAKQIEQELQARRKKRRREEQRYALKELSEDRKTSAGELTSSMTGSLSGSSPTDISSAAGAEAGFMTGGSISADFSGMEGMSVDISV